MTQSSIPQGEMPDEGIAFTARAAIKVKSLLETEEEKNQYLRVYITGGGCAGFSYGFKFDQQLSDTDTQVERDGVTLVIDQLSIQYLSGSTVDYSEGLMGSQFVVNNPNATTTCGCGSSFSI